MRIRFKKILVVFALANLIIVDMALSGGLEPGSRDALQKTQEMLRDPIERNKVIGESDRAMKVNREVEVMMGSSQNSNEVYDLSAEVFAKLAEEANGDPDRMMQLLTMANQNPSLFAEKWSPDQKQKLKRIAERMPASARQEKSYPVEIVK
jgi:hypothetical protein